MQETELRLGLTLTAARLLKPALDAAHVRKSIVNRIVIVKVANDDFSPDPAALIDIKVKLIGDETLLSVKYGSWHGDAVRQEYEVNFRRDDLPNLLAVLKLLGYTKFIVLSTVRTTWLGSGVVLTLDEYPKLDRGLFEVELAETTGTETQISSVFTDLGLTPMDSEQTVSFIADINQSQKIQIDLDRLQPTEFADRLLAEC